VVGFCIVLMKLKSVEKMDTSRNYEPILNTLYHYEVCQKVSIYFDTYHKALNKALYFIKLHMWGNGL